MKKCSGCNCKITAKNDGLSLTRGILSTEEMKTLNLLGKKLCVKCKREMLFAGILNVI